MIVYVSVCVYVCFLGRASWVNINECVGGRGPSGSQAQLQPNPLSRSPAKRNTTSHKRARVCTQTHSLLQMHALTFTLNLCAHTHHFFIAVNMTVLRRKEEREIQRRERSLRGKRKRERKIATEGKKEGRQKEEKIDYDRAGWW